MNPNEELETVEENPLGTGGGVLLGLLLGAAGVGGVWYYKNRTVSDPALIATTKAQVMMLSGATGPLTGKMTPYTGPSGSIQANTAGWTDPNEPAFVAALIGVQTALNSYAAVESGYATACAALGVQLPLRTDGVLDHTTYDAIALAMVPG